MRRCACTRVCWRRAPQSQQRDRAARKPSRDACQQSAPVAERPGRFAVYYRTQVRAAIVERAKPARPRATGRSGAVAGEGEQVAVAVAAFELAGAIERGVRLVHDVYFVLEFRV